MSNSSRKTTAIDHAVPAYADRDRCVKTSSNTSILLANASNASILLAN